MTREELWKKIWEKGTENLSCNKCPYEHECYETATEDERCSDYLRGKYDEELQGGL